MKNCPACGKGRLTEADGIRRCSENCGFVQETNPPESAEWLLAISENNAYWRRDFFEKLPVFIAHQYRRLWLMTCRPNVFCMVYQLKDVAEMLLKFPVLCAAAYLNDDAVSSQLVKKTLSIGDWKDIAHILVGKRGGKTRFELPECLRHILEGIVAIYADDKLDVTYHRNDYLGHGAMGFDDNADYRAFGENLIARISAYLSDVMEDYAGLRVTLGGRELTGWKLPESVSPEDELTLHIEGREIPLYPYIARSEKDGMLFFDYYDASRHNNRLAKGLNYIRGGGRKSFVAPYYCEVYQRSFGDKEKYLSGGAEKSLERDSSTRTIEKVLSELNEADHFERPEYLIRWVKNWLSDDQGSVHWLVMERGMGKSAFSYALASGKVHVGDVTVCAYFCGQSAMRRECVTGVNNALAGDIIWVQQPRENGENANEMGLRFDAEDKRSNMIETLRYFRDEHAYFHQTSKLLLIIDGVDELPRENADIFDYLPDPADMPDNTYILVTSRNPDTEKLPAHIASALHVFHDFHASDTLRVFPDTATENGANNHKTLKAYAKSKIGLLDGGAMRKLSDGEAEHIISRAGGVFLNLRLYAKLAESGIPVFRLPELDSRALFERYLGEIRRYYGDKLFDEAMTVLYAIVTAEEPLTLREAAWLSGEEYVTIKLLAFLRDFGALLRTVRVEKASGEKAVNTRGSLISPANESYAGYMKELFPAKRAELAEIFTGKLTEADPARYRDGQGHDTLPDGLFYMAAYLPTVTEDISEELRDKVYYDIDDCVKNSTEPHILSRRAKMGKEWSVHCKKAGWYWHQLGFMLMADYSYWTMCDYQSALAIENERVTMCEQYLAEGRINDRNDLASAYLSRGATYNDTGKYDDALAEYDMCIGIREELDRQEKLYDRDDLASAYNNRGNTNYSTGKHDKALEDYDRCISIREELDRQGKLYDRNDLATAYMNRGATYTQTGRYDEALEDYDRCIGIKEELDRQGKLYDRNDLATAYMNRGVTYWMIDNHDEELEDYSRCIGIREELDRQGKLYDRNDLATAYMGRGWTYGIFGKYDEALAEYNRCIGIREELNQQGKLYEIGHLASAMLNKGILLFNEFHDAAGALELWNQASTMLEAKESLSYFADNVLNKLRGMKIIVEFFAERDLSPNQET